MRTAVQSLLWLLVLLASPVQPLAADVATPHPGYTITALAPVGAGKPGFTRLELRQTGVWFTNALPESRYLTNQILPNGSGVAAGDVDGDGWCDLYFCGLDSDNRLYRNLGQWRFEELAAQAGVACPGLDATGAALVDFNGDGTLDLIVNSIGGGTHLFANDGHAHFRELVPALNPQRGGTSLALADIDRDGDLDLYIANYRAATLTDAPGTRFSFKVTDGQPAVSLVNGRPLTDSEWTNRFVFHVALGPGGRGKFSHEELGEPDVLCLNDGQGRFTPVSFTGGAFLDDRGAPLAQPPHDWGLAALFRDFDGDGDPDLYVCNDFSTPDRFWLNDGRGHFRAAPPLALRQTSLAAMAGDAADLNRDGHDDFLVVDMLSREHERRLTQRNIMRAELAPAGQIEARPQYPRNTLFLSRGDGTYAEIAQYAGLEASEWSWNPIFIDVDLDGFEDVLIPNGFVRDNMNLDAMNRINAAKSGRRLAPVDELELRRYYPVLNTPNLAFRNQGNLRFAECGAAWGFAEAAISQGACLADLDNDGDLDVVLNNLNRAASVYRNDSPAPRLAVRLRGRPPNTGGIGARVTVSGGPVVQSQEIVCGGRYVSSDQAQRSFAAGTAVALEVRVRWRMGHETVVSNVPPNSAVEVFEPDVEGRVPQGPGAGQPGHAELVPAGGGVREAPALPALRFTDVSDAIGHTHQDAPYNDFERQPLLPRKLSQLGPGVAWWDMDGDARDDLVIGSGKGGPMALYRNLGEGRFQRQTASPWGLPSARDAAGLAGAGPGALWIAFANYEDGATNQPGVMQWTPAGAVPILPLAASSFGPLAAADYDGDGQLDLFVGGRAVPGRYPEPPRSQLWRRRAGEWELDGTNSGRLATVGMVSGAVWTDLDGDGWPELVLAREWGSLLVFRNARGTLTDWNPPIRFGAEESQISNLRSQITAASPQPATLGALSGWWNGVAAGDFDSDGRLDLIAANWGANTRYERWRPAALRIAYGDFAQDGTVGILENHFVPELSGYAPDRMLDAVMRSLPQLAERFPTHQAWARATIDTVLGDGRGAARQVEAVWLETTLFLNRGDHLEVHTLPPEAQFAPAFAVCVGDADGDGHEDAFLSQNFFDVDMDTSRADAGRGLWLRGDGRGGLSPVRGQDCGVRIDGEQRGAALGDFDADGRVDLVVTQNGAATRLFRNTAAKPGLRVRLDGPAGNPHGVGAVVRLRHGEQSGPAREVHAGSGYWSQDSPVLVLGLAGVPTAIHVRWPGGRLTESAIPVGAREVKVGENGVVQVIAP